MNLEVMGAIAIWWILAPVLGFWVSLIIGRYFYARINEAIAMDRSSGPLVELDRTGGVPIPRPHETTGRPELHGVVTVLPIGTKVNIVMTMNARMLMHIEDVRAAADAQWEIRNMTEQILDLAEEWAPITFEYYNENMKYRKNRLAP